MSEILKNYLPKDLVRLIQSYLLPNIFDIYAGKIEINNEIRNYYITKEDELYNFYINYYRGETYISAYLLN